MDKHFSIIYKDFVKSNNGSFIEIVKKANINWGSEFYDDKVSYEDNLYSISSYIFDAGFAEIYPGKIIPSSCILQIIAFKENDLLNKANSSSENLITQTEDEIKNDQEPILQNAKNNLNQKHNKYRKIKRFNKQKNS